MYFCIFSNDWKNKIEVVFDVFRKVSNDMGIILSLGIAPSRELEILYGDDAAIQPHIGSALSSRKLECGRFPRLTAT